MLPSYLHTETEHWQEIGRKGLTLTRPGSDWRKLEPDLHGSVATNPCESGSGRAAASTAKPGETAVSGTLTLRVLGSRLMPNQLNTDAFRVPATRAALFATTHWSVVLEAARPESPGAAEAFAQIYRDYWYPLYAYVRRRGRSPHEAEDLTQDFFVCLLERDRLSRAGAGRRPVPIVSAQGAPELPGQRMGPCLRQKAGRRQSYRFP